jgi:hypothetical protein
MRLSLFLGLRFLPGIQHICSTQKSAASAASLYALLKGSFRTSCGNRFTLESRQLIAIAIRRDQPHSCSLPAFILEAKRRVVLAVVLGVGTGAGTGAGDSGGRRSGLALGLALGLKQD